MVARLLVVLNDFEPARCRVALRLAVTAMAVLSGKYPDTDDTTVSC
jgi:hypothetical protein